MSRCRSRATFEATEESEDELASILPAFDACINSESSTVLAVFFGQVCMLILHIHGFQRLQSAVSDIRSKQKSIREAARVYKIGRHSIKK